MSFLDELSDKDRENIISLPYRVGLWISQSDTSGGDESDEEEKNTLLSLLHGYAQEVFGSETVQHIITETLQKKERWASWDTQLGDVPGDCIIAIENLSNVVDEKELNAYRHHLVEIAESVALAFREEETAQSFMEKIQVYVAYFQGKFKAHMEKRSYKTFDQFLNISMAERKALLTLAHALDTKYY